MQLLSRLNTTKAVSQVTTIRGKTMASLPPELAPATLVKLLNGGSGTASSSSTGGAKLAVAGNSTSGSSDSAFSIGNIDGEIVKTYGSIAIALLATNVVVGLVLLGFAVLNCVRRGSDKRRGIPGTGASTHYVPVGLDDEAFPAHRKGYAD
jgi:saccharopepsin